MRNVLVGLLIHLECSTIMVSGCGWGCPDRAPTHVTQVVQFSKRAGSHGDKGRAGQQQQSPRHYIGPCGLPHVKARHARQVKVALFNVK